MSGVSQGWMHDTNEDDFDHLNEVNKDLAPQMNILEDLYASVVFANLTAHFPNNSPEQN